MVKKKQKRGGGEDDEDFGPQKEPIALQENEDPKESQAELAGDGGGDEDVGVKKGKKGKKSKRKKDVDEDEIERMLAELRMEEEAGEIKPAAADGPKKTEDASMPPDNQQEGTASEKPAEEDTEEKPEKKKKKGKKIVFPKDDDEEEEEKGEEQEGDVRIKTAAEKKKEKKERERLKKLEQKQKKVEKKPETPAAPTESVAAEAGKEPPTKQAEAAPEVSQEGLQEDMAEPDDEAGTAGKKGKKKKKDVAAAGDKKKKGPGAKAIAAMQEALKKAAEEEEKQRRKEEEDARRLEELENARLERIRQEKERKERKKQKEKEKIARQKAEGTYLTAKQRADRARALAQIEAMKQAGIQVGPLEKPSRPTKKDLRKKPGKGGMKKSGSMEEESPVAEQSPEAMAEDKEEETEKEKEAEEVKDAWDAEEEEEVKESWDIDSGDEKDENGAEKAEARSGSGSEEGEGEDDEEEGSEEEDEEDSEEESESEDEEEKNKRKATAEERIRKRREENEKNRIHNSFRQPVVCVLGHVDTGKTKILDKLRRTHVQEGEAGGITQQIGATNVPKDAMLEQCKMVQKFDASSVAIPGMLIIDTPGHESFSNLRSRGSSLCDIAILVVDIMHGLEPQTIESLNLLKKGKTPFVVALNKIDRLYEWKSNRHKDVREVVESQELNVRLEFDTRVKGVITQFAEQGLNATLFYQNPNPREYVSMVPTSAHTGEGMGNLMALLTELTQKMLSSRITFSDELQATVMEVKALPGLGTTIDVILVNGCIGEGQTIVLAGTEGPIVTQIRSLLMPEPMKELRVKNAYSEFKEVKAAQGVKIAGKDLEKAIAGLNLQVAYHPDEVDICRGEVTRELRSALSSIKLKERGVYVQASTLGSLEALLEFLRTSKIPYAGIKIGPVVKRDVMKSSIMLEHDSQYAVILAFDVKVERDAQELADSVGVKIFQADIIYHLFDAFMHFREELKAKRKKENEHIAVFPCKIKILPQFIFNTRDPIVVGVMVESGILKIGTPLCVPTKEFVDIGIVTSIEVNHKPLDTPVRKGQEVCIKIEPTGDTPKLLGRHFEATDMLVSKISRESIDACKEFFRDDLVKADWQLMIELKKLFRIL